MFFGSHVVKLHSSFEFQDEAHHFAKFESPCWRLIPRVLGSVIIESEESHCDTPDIFLQIGSVHPVQAQR